MEQFFKNENICDVFMNEVVLEDKCLQESFEENPSFQT